MLLKPTNNFIWKRKDLLNISILIIIMISIFYPLFYSEYAYTDEYVQLWFYKKGTDFQMFAVQGRYVTEKLFRWLFSNAETIHDITTIRLFSFFGWVACIPLWYFIIKKLIEKEKLSSFIPFFSVLYLICSPSFSVYVQWASCLEHFIAATAGLMSGYILYSSLRDQQERIALRNSAIAGCILFGVISLATYQNGFGSFFLPFIIYLATKPRNVRIVLIAIIFCFLIYVIYYSLFKTYLRINHLEASGRANISIDLFPKIRFFLGKALVIAFQFNYLFNETNWNGKFLSALFLFTWIAFDFRISGLPFIKYLKPFAFSMFLLVLIYLPSLIVKENYAPNRTVFALNMAVFFLVANTLFTAIKKYKTRLVVVIILSFAFVANAWYNFNTQFLGPVKNEYRQVRNYVEQNYNATINTVYFIQPHEDFFVRRYGITRSWDEFGVPSTFFNWVPEFFVKQVIFEKTGSREVAEKMVTRQWPDKKTFRESSVQVSQNVMLINVEDILNH